MDPLDNSLALPVTPPRVDPAQNEGAADAARRAGGFEFPTTFQGATPSAQPAAQPVSSSQPSVASRLWSWTADTARGYATGAANLVLDAANLTNMGVNAGLSAVGASYRFRTDMHIDPQSQTEAYAQNAITVASMLVPAGAAREGLVEGASRLGGLGRVTETARAEMQVAERQLQKKFVHAGDFGVSGNYSRATAQQFEEAIRRHLADPATQRIAGTYRGNPVTHFFNPNTGLNVIEDPAGNFLSGWRLSPAQIAHLPNLGGG